jgi:hypothetical protein
MKIAVLIPTRGDRKEFLNNALRLIKNQTLQPDHIEIVDFEPLDSACDITPRYRFGYEKLSKMGFDVILLMEDDDFYAKNYIETMISEWIDAGKPDIFGTTYTIYYNIRVWGQFRMEHYQRSSAMSTLIKPSLEIKWPLNNDPYTDVALYNQLKYKLFTPKEVICLGIKHGIGLCGGRSHVDGLQRYSTNGGLTDPDKSWIKSIVDEESFKFYKSLNF